jgi:hypothetical protein
MQKCHDCTTVNALNNTLIVCSKLRQAVLNIIAFEFQRFSEGCSKSLFPFRNSFYHINTG